MMTIKWQQPKSAFRSLRSLGKLNRRTNRWRILTIVTLFWATLLANSAFANCDANRCTYSNIPIDKAGFYVARVKLATGAPEGMWGLSVNTTSGINSGGFNAGAALTKNGDTPGFLGFYLSQMEAVKISAFEYTGNVGAMNILLETLDSQGNRATVHRFKGFRQSSTAQPFVEEISQMLAPGFYIISAFSDSGATSGSFGISVNGDSLAGGVNIGGWIDATTTGFGAFAVDSPQQVNLELLFGDNYGSVGSGALTVEIDYQDESGGRVLYWSSSDPTPVASESLAGFCATPPIGWLEDSLSDGETVDTMVQQGVVLKDSRWSNGKTVKITFDFQGQNFSGVAEVCRSISSQSACERRIKDEIINAANVWSQYGNIRFQFEVPWSEGEIRIRLDGGGGGWSYVGIGALSRSTNENTMQLGVGYALRPVTIHEFGHAIGFMHEHQSPKVPYTWNREQVYRDFSNWSREKVDSQVLTPLDKLSYINKTQLFVTEYDPLSKMVYSIPSRWVSVADKANPESCPSRKPDWCVESTTELSEIDKWAVAQMYPFSTNQFEATFKRVEYYKPTGYCPADRILVWLLFETSGVNTSDLQYVEEKSVYQTDPNNPYVEPIRALNAEGLVVRGFCAPPTLKSDFQVRLKQASTGQLSTVMTFTVDVSSAAVFQEAPPLTWLTR